jgi:uncharacterized integral membrane protein
MFTLDIVNKYISIYKEEITNRVIENLTPLLIKSLKYYGIHQIISGYYDLLVNSLILMILLLIVKIVTNTLTTANARAPLIIIILINFIMEQLVYCSYYFIMIQAYLSICPKMIIRWCLFGISFLIYIKCHITCDDVQFNTRITHQQPQIVYNIVNNVAYNNIEKQTPTKIIDLSGEITEDDEFIKEKNDKKGVGEKKKNGEKRKYARKTKEKKN